MIKYENKSNGRFYYLEIKRDLIGDLVLCITRGGNNVSVIRTLGFTSRMALDKELARICKKRERRGYELVA
jgi:hypothetical protein